MQLFELKRSYELTWEDIPFVECPTFAHIHAFNALNAPQDMWTRVINIHEFSAAEFSGYDQLQHYRYAEDRLRQMMQSGEYLSISRSGKPFVAAFTWKENKDHPHQGEWTDPQRHFWMNPNITQQLARIAHQWHKRQTQAFMDEVMDLPYAIARTVEEKVVVAPRAMTTAIEKPSPVATATKNNPIKVSNVSDSKKPAVNTKTKSRSGYANENEYDQLIWQASQDHGVPPEILKAKIRKESGFNNSAINKKNVDGSTTVGLGQFTELTAINMGLNVDPANGIDERTNPSKTIPAQAKYLREIYDEYRDVAISDADGWRYALAGYNLGPAKVDKQLKLAAPHMKNGTIPYNHPSMTFHKGSYTPTIMGATGDIDGWAAEYSSDFDKYRN